MSTLNLIPDLELLCVQTGVFLANLVVVKKLIINPYLELQKKRQAHTALSQGEAEASLADCARQMAALEQRVQEAYTHAGDEAARLKAAALSEQNRLVSRAKERSHERLSTMRQQLAAQLADERAKAPALAARLSKEFYDKLTR